MLTGIMLSGILAGLVSLFAGLAFEAGMALAALGYVTGGMCGCLAFVQIAIERGHGEID